MEGLYNKVIKGQLAKIPDRFSTDLAEIVRMLIQVSPEARPSCGTLEFYKIFTVKNFKIKIRSNFKTSSCTKKNRVF